MLSISSIGEKFLPTAIAIYACCMLSPYFIWGRHYLYVVSCLLVVALFIMWSLYRKVLNINYIPFVGLVFSCIFLFYLCSGASLSWALIQSIGSGLLLFSYRQFGNRLLVTFKWVFVITLVPSMFLWFWYAVGLPVDIWQIGIIDDSVVPNQLKVQGGMHYYLYIGSVALDYMIDSGLPVFRICGMYDEPGVVGTVSGLMLAADRVNLKKKVNILLFAAGVMSLSLAFFVLVALSLVFYIRWKIILILILIIVPGFLTLSNSMQKVLHGYTVSRLVIKDSGKLAGDNRESELSKQNFNNWLKSDLFQFMFGSQVQYDSSATYKQILTRTGLVGFMLIAVVLFIPFFARPKTYAAIVFFIIYILSIYQRPTPLHFPFFMIFWCGIMRLSRLSENGELIKRT